MSTEDRFDLIFKALSDSRRRKILDLLKEKAMTTSALTTKFKNLDRCTVMQHLDVLEKADLILIKREGRFRWNYINPLPLKEITDRWIGEHAMGAVNLIAKIKRDLES